MECYQLPLVAMDRNAQNENFTTNMAMYSPPSTTPSRSMRLPQESSNAASPNAVIDENLRCRYSNKKCMNPRTAKRTGGLHTFCDEHRENANRNQRRLDQKKRKEKRQRESIQSYFETLQAVAEQENAAGVAPHPPLYPNMSMTTASPVNIDPLTRPAALLDEDVDVLVSLFGPADPPVDMNHE